MVKHGLLALVLGYLAVSAGAALARAPAAAVVHFPDVPEVRALAEALEKELQEAGYQTAALDAAALCDPARLSRQRFDLLVLPDSSALPADAIAPITAFLRAGGDIMALRTPLWQQILVHADGGWITRDEYERQHAADTLDHPVLSFTGAEKWQRTTNHPEFTASYTADAEGPAPGERGLHVVLSNLQGWDTYLSQEVREPFAGGRTLTVFSARGGPRTDQLAVEWRERDGSRWFAVVPLGPQWRRIVLAPSDFEPWPWTSDRRRRFNPQQAVQLGIGLAFSHTGQISGRHEYWVGPIGTDRLTPEYERVLQASTPPALDTLSPAYKLFDCTDVAALSAAPMQSVLAPTTFALPHALRSPQPRPEAGGFAKGRAWRWLPLLAARTGAGEWRGTPATLLVNVDGTYKGGVWASFGITDLAWYTTPTALSAIGQIARRMRDRAFMMDGGSNFYTYFEDQELKLGLTAANLGDASRADLAARILVSDAETGAVVFQHEWPLVLAPGETRAVSKTWKPPGSVKSPLRVTAELLESGKPLDRTSHEAYIWRPAPDKHFVTVRNGGFELDGRRWRAHGVNYMPSSGIGTEDGDYFEHWLGARSYDPAVIQRDLDHIGDLGFNSVSIFIDRISMEAQNFLDLLRRLDAMGMKANLSLRPADPMHFGWEPIRELIEHYRLPERDTIFAYDLAWEPMFRGHNERRPYDRDWEAWIAERYGSVAAAEKDWGYAVPRDKDGRLTNPSAQQIDTDGPWRRMVAAYRRFLDTILYQRHAAARRLVRELDTRHLVSFRMTEAGNPTMRVDGWIPYDFPYLALGVDMLAPEAYGRIGDWEQVRPGLFEVAYGRWAAPDKPLIWAEAGVSTWDATHATPSAERLKFQADLYRYLYRMLIASGSDGVFFWWYPGGFRVGEASDFGIINPDGSDRPVTTVIREHAKRFLEAPAAPRPDTWIEIDRDAHPDGVAGVYDAAKAAFWQAVEAGRTPGLRTVGTGTDSTNCPLLAVGNTPMTGTNPPKFLDACFDVVQVLGADGQWHSVEKGGRVEVKSGQPALSRLAITNVNEAAWVAPVPGRLPQPGAVSLVAERADTAELVRLPLAARVERGQAARFDNVALTSPLAAPTKLTLTLAGRTRFSERFTLELVPR